MCIRDRYTSMGHDNVNKGTSKSCHGSKLQDGAMVRLQLFTYKCCHKMQKIQTQEITSKFRLLHEKSLNIQELYSKFLTTSQAIQNKRHKQQLGHWICIQ